MPLQANKKDDEQRATAKVTRETKSYAPCKRGGLRVGGKALVGVALDIDHEQGEQSGDAEEEMSQSYTILGKRKIILLSLECCHDCTQSSS